MKWCIGRLTASLALGCFAETSVWVSWAEGKKLQSVISDFRSMTSSSMDSFNISPRLSCRKSWEVYYGACNILIYQARGATTDVASLLGICNTIFSFPLYGISHLWALDRAQQVLGAHHSLQPVLATSKCCSSPRLVWLSQSTTCQNPLQSSAHTSEQRHQPGTHIFISLIKQVNKCLEITNIKAQRVK